MSLYQTAKAIGISPRVYLRDVIMRMAAAAPEQREALAAELTPHRWRETLAGEVRDHQLAIVERLLAQWPAASGA